MTRRAALGAALLVLAVAAVALWADPVFAQSMGPFGPRSAAPPPPPPPPDGVIGWILARQAEFYRAMSGTVRAAKTDGTAVWTLLGIAFLYGVFHAAGPGHGKAVISSYMVANRETWRRGVVLSFASAALQAVVAVAVVGVAAAVLNATARQICDAERVIEIVSYGLIALLGARLAWVKGRGLLRAAAGLRRTPAPLGAAVTPKDHGHEHHGHAHSHSHAHAHHDHAHHAHVHDAHCDHCASAWDHGHGPSPAELAGPGGWTRGLTAIAAVGLRPCSGAILLLVFALAQGLFWAGVAATFMMALGTAITVAAIAVLAVGARSLAERFAAPGAGYGAVALRGLEFGAAVLILSFGSLLLAGYLAAERSACL